MTPPFPAPPITPLKRLHVYDSLMMTAQRWQAAHGYHRQRQNIHYQSLHQPGIVCGLGVVLTDPPESAESQYKDKCWIEIQPGIAIDVTGNVIVIDDIVDRKYHIAATPPAKGSITVYVVISYVEPCLPAADPYPDLLQEQFRFDQKTEPPEPHEIELCRIQLSQDFVHLEIPSDVYFPEKNQLDFTHRLQAQVKPLATVRVTQVQLFQSASFSPSAHQPLSALVNAAHTLYPALEGVAAPEILTLDEKTVAQYPLLYVVDPDLSSLSSTAEELLGNHLKTGGVLWIELLQANEFAIASLQEQIAQTFEITVQFWNDLKSDHPLRTQPFLFAAPPMIDQQPLQVWSGGGVVITVGSLVAGCSADSNPLRSRSELRTAHEFGINILHFAWKRRHLTQLQMSSDG